jgi:hypothetical protein
MHGTMNVKMAELIVYILITLMWDIKLQVFAVSVLLEIRNK